MTAYAVKEVRRRQERRRDLDALALVQREPQRAATMLVQAILDCDTLLRTFDRSSAERPVSEDSRP